MNEVKKYNVKEVFDRYKENGEYDLCANKLAEFINNY